MPRQVLDEQKQKLRTSRPRGPYHWARQQGEAPITRHTPLQCLHPVDIGRVPNLLRNGVLRSMLQERPQLKHLLLHIFDTLGADLDPALLGVHIDRELLNFE